MNKLKKTFEKMVKERNLDVLEQINALNDLCYVPFAISCLPDVIMMPSEERLDYVDGELKDKYIDEIAKLLDFNTQEDMFKAVIAAGYYDEDTVYDIFSFFTDEFAAFM